LVKLYINIALLVLQVIEELMLRQVRWYGDVDIGYLLLPATTGAGATLYSMFILTAADRPMRLSFTIGSAYGFWRKSGTSACTLRALEVDFGNIRAAASLLGCTYTLVDN
jgi:hypothetical protein